MSGSTSCLFLCLYQCFYREQYFNYLETTPWQSPHIILRLGGQNGLSPCEQGAFWKRTEREVLPKRDMKWVEPLNVAMRTWTSYWTLKKQQSRGYIGSKSCSEDGPLFENEHRRMCCRDFRLHTYAALLLGWVQPQKAKVTHPWGQAHSLHTFQIHRAEPVTLSLNY